MEKGDWQCTKRMYGKMSDTGVLRPSATKRRDQCLGFVNRKIIA